MGTSFLSISRLGQLAVAGTCAGLLVIGMTAGAASAQDLHSGGSSPNEEAVDPGRAPTDVGGSTESGGGTSLPVTGSDVAGLVGMGVAAVAVGSSAVAVSKRRARLSA